MRFIFIICLVLVSTPLLAQTNLGSAALAGVVRDPSGAAVPDAKVDAIETDRGLTRETRSNESGAFLFPTIPPGRYNLRVGKEGFDSTEITGISIEVGARTSLDVDLNPGRVSSVVTVTADGQADRKQ